MDSLLTVKELSEHLRVHPNTIYDFIKKQSIIGYTKPALQAVLSDIKTLAGIEGLDAHVKSAEIRFKEPI